MVTAGSLPSSTATTRVETGSTPPLRPAAAYRLDLDGLRGLAIALVVVFHVWFGRVSGGVDVFLVLSGFFFTGLLLRQVESSRSVRVLFTMRRTLRRLLPALAVVLAAVVAATVALRPFTQWSDIADQTLASAFYYQNWHLALTWSDYLAADPSVSPLQHLWSMAVQGQFYVAVVLLVAALTWACERLGHSWALRPVLALTVAVLAVLSFVYADNGSAAHQGWNYYDSFARAWELLAGALLAIAVPWLSVPRVLRVVLAVAGLAIVGACGFLVDGANRFPGPAALLPVGAAAALIVAGNNLELASRPFALRALASRPMVELGALSYSLYLWHWPILIFFLFESGASTAGFVGGFGVIAVSSVLAYATQHFVEEPLRLRSKQPSPMTMRYRRGVGVAVSTVGVIAIGLGMTWHVAMSAHPPQLVGYLNPAQYPGAEALASGAHVPQAPMRPSVFEAPAELPYPTTDGCIADWDTREAITCTYGDAAAERTMAVVGSSHAEHWIPALVELANEHHFRIQVYLKMGCPLTVANDPSYKGEPIPDCHDWSREVIDLLGEQRPDWVFTTGTRPRDDAGDETPQDYLDVWTELSDRGLNVIAIRDTPWLRRDQVRYRAADCLAKGGDRIGCGMSRDYALDPVNPAAAPAASFPNVFPLDLTDAICETDVCPVAEGNILIYHDEHHLTTSYSRSLAPELGRQLHPILGWW
ncbi:acyltransferase family protein [Nocardia australiensis]|uniref:acyltransferase family protein n=1 Tax=Nocardia australiensis TaxID=2887191 RepID=UPI003558FEA1